MEFDLNQLNKGINAKSKEVGARKKAGQSADDVIAEVTSLKADLKSKEEALVAAEAAIQRQLRLVGNLVHSSVPVSLTEDDNVVVKQWGTNRPPTKFHHHELLHMIDGYSAERGRGRGRPPRLLPQRAWACC